MQAFISSKASRTSSFVIQSSVKLFNFAEYFRATRSSQPHLLGLPVVAPNSCPSSAIFCPSSQNSSVGNGPAPTLVV